MLRWRSLGELSLINITWAQEVSGGPKSCNQLSHLGDSGPISGQSIKTLPASVFRKKEEKIMNRLNCQTNGKSKTKQTKSHKEICIHTLTRREKKKKE